MSRINAKKVVIVSSKVMMRLGLPLDIRLIINKIVFVENRKLQISEGEKNAFIGISKSAIKRRFAKCNICSRCGRYLSERHCYKKIISTSEAERLNLLGSDIRSLVENRQRKFSDASFIRERLMNDIEYGRAMLKGELAISH